MKDTHDLHQIVYNHYADKIRFGIYRKGDSLPTIEKISGQFNISINTARQSLINLEQDGYVRLTRGRPAIVTASYSDEECRAGYIEHFTVRHDALEELRAFLPVIFAKTLLHALYFMKPKGSEKLTELILQTRLEDSLPFFYPLRFVLSSLGNPLLESIHLDASMFTHLSRKRMNDIGIPYDMSVFTTFLNDFSRISDFKASEDYAGMCQLLTKICTLLSEQIGHLNRTVTDQFGENPDQLPFIWHIQAGRPQVYYSVAVRMIAEVRKGLYKNDEFLPTPSVLAEKYGVSLISIRRTIALLNSVCLTETINGLGTRISLNHKSLEHLDLSNPGTRKSLLFYLMGLQLVTICIRSIARESFDTIPPERIQEILRFYEQESQSGQYLFTHGQILKTVIYSHKNSEIWAIFSPLIHIMSWGIPLNYLGDSDMASKGTQLDLLIGLLQSGDKEGFAKHLEQSSRSSLVRERQKLLDAGLSDAADILVPEPSILELAESCIHFELQ
ncbi:GntR family transcriptional regulator [Eubacterium sp. 1001713B170207_170306_E7]|uniref:GntR family transcriptional regulator n=1 Tax=Eubacterium sp. 1001713B170207_170306_E7 TaxID=2787097 RepID=UPI00189914CB|nr:GntR family transcriptional regulator [Eubacterium sp. 1001713B170207_170306_E7]